MATTTRDASRAMEKIKKKSAKAWTKSQGKAPTIQGARLPDGIIGGIARFVDWQISETDDKKIPYLRMTFMCDEPTEFAGVKESIMYFFAESEYNTIQDVTDRVGSDLQLMGHEIEGVDVGDGWVELLETSKQEETAIVFNTRGGKTKAGKDWHKFDIQGLAEGYEPPEPETAVEGEEAEGDAETEEDGTETEATPEEDADWEPVKGDEYMYRRGPKNKLEEHTVTTVSKGKKTVTLQRNRDSLVVKDVPWDKLEGA